MTYFKHDHAVGVWGNAAVPPRGDSEKCDGSEHFAAPEGQSPYGSTAVKRYVTEFTNGSTKTPRHKVTQEGNSNFIIDFSGWISVIGL